MFKLGGTNVTEEASALRIGISLEGPSPFALNHLGLDNFASRCRSRLNGTRMFQFPSERLISAFVNYRNDRISSF